MEDRNHSKTPSQMIRCLSQGAVIGGIVGTVIFFFKLVAHHLEELSLHIYSTAKESPFLAICVFAGLILLAVSMYLLHQFAPESKGGGIPRATGIMRATLKFRRLRTFIATTIGSLISFFAGLPLGSEGPGVLIGTSLGSIFTSPDKKEGWGQYAPTAGAGAGFAVATGAPITSIIFIIEEVHRRMTVSLVLITSVSALTASFVNSALCEAFGISPSLFNIATLPEFSLTHLGYVLLLGVLIAVFVWLFDVCVISFKRLMDKAKGRIRDIFKLIFVFAAVGAVGFVYPTALYSGHGLILGIVDSSMAIELLVLLFLWRFIMIIFTSSSKATGGSFVPTLCIGALAGALSFELLSLIGMPREYCSIVILISMCAFLGGTMRAPLTATLFFIEATAQSSNLLYAALVIFVVHFITTTAGKHSFNDVMLEEMVTEQAKTEIRNLS